MAIDPVCGMTVDPARAAGEYEHAGASYYFCNPSCLTRFKADPASFLQPTTAPAAQGGSFRAQVETLERNLLQSALQAAGGNQSEAARRLSLSRVTFLDKLKRYGIEG